MKEADVKARAYAMPLTNPAYPPGPYRFKDREFLIITYRTDLEKLRAVVPEPLEVDEALVTRGVDSIKKRLDNLVQKGKLDAGKREAAIGRLHATTSLEAAGRADFVVEAHDTHHPIASGLYYEDQKKEAKRRTADFLENRAPKYFGYFEDVLARNRGSKYLVGKRLTYADLSLFQIVAGMRYAFPKASAKLEKKLPRVVAVHDLVAKRPRIAAYLASERRIPFNEIGIFRHYKELDA